MDERTQKIVLGVLLVAMLGYLGYTFGYQPRAERLQELETRLSALEIENRTARVIGEQGGEGAVEARLRQYSDQLARVEGLVPSSEELPLLLDAISMEAQRTGVELTLIQPVGAEAEEYYVRRTYDLAVLGSYHEIGEFLTRIGSLSRIVTPLGLNLAVREEETRTGDPELHATFSIETYVLPNPVAEEVDDAA